MYGRTKAEAEQVVMQNPAHAVVRIALTAGTSSSHDRSFVEDMLRAVGKGTTLTLFTDEFRCPVAAKARRQGASSANAATSSRASAAVLP